MSKVIAYLAGSEVEIPSLLYERLRQRDAPRTTDTSAYCQARLRLPEALLEKLFRETGETLEEKVTAEYFWCGRNVKVIDGSTVSMPVHLISFL